MAEFLYVDNSNVFIEGKRVSAVKRGIALSIEDAIRSRVLDNDYRMDFGRLHDLIAGREPSQIKRAVPLRLPSSQERFSLGDGAPQWL